MSESSGEKTEQPTDKKLRDARKKGQVAKSADVSSTWLLILAFCYLGIMKEFYLDHLTQLLTLPTLFYSVPFKSALKEVLGGCMYEFIIMSIPFLGLIAINAIFINMVQIGPLLTFEPLKPDIKKLNPVQGAKKIFSKKNLIEFVKSIIKVSFLGYLIYRVIRSVIDPLLKIPYSGLGAVIDLLIPIMKMFAINTCVAYTIIAVADLFFQRSQHISDLKMTKDEVKREFKEMEGDPLIKGERKQLHQELAMSDTVQSTKSASALVTNPTHVAVALFYNENAVKLPVVTAKGKGGLALQMIKVARENNIPIMRDVNLAHSLYETKEYEYVPSDLIPEVAAVLKWAAEIYHGKQ